MLYGCELSLDVVNGFYIMGLWLFYWRVVRLLLLSFNVLDLRLNGLQVIAIKGADSLSLVNPHILKYYVTKLYH